MKRFHLKKQRSLVSSRRNYPLYAAATVFLALVVALGVLVIRYGSLSRAMAANRENLVLSIRGNINAVVHAYEKTQLPGADIEGELLPTMRLSLNAAAEMNDVLIDSYGEQYAVLSAELFRELQNNLNSYSDVLDKGQMLTDAQAAMGQTLDLVEKALVTRFGSDDGLMPVTAST